VAIDCLAAQEGNIFAFCSLCQENLFAFVSPWAEGLYRWAGAGRKTRLLTSIVRFAAPLYFPKEIPTEQVLAESLWQKSEF
jgi:hypothetical protein